MMPIPSHSVSFGYSHNCRKPLFSETPMSVEEQLDEAVQGLEQGAESEKQKSLGKFGGFRK